MTNTNLIGAAIVIAVALAAVVLLQQPTNSAVSDSPSPTGAVVATTGGVYTLTEVAKHSTDADCWTAINGKVYDLSSFIALGQHGPAISNGCGIDASSLFEKHSDNAKANLENYYMGDLA